MEGWLKIVSNKFTRIRPIDLNPNAVLWFALFVTLYRNVLPWQVVIVACTHKLHHQHACSFTFDQFTSGHKKIRIFHSLDNGLPVEQIYKEVVLPDYKMRQLLKWTQIAKKIWCITWRILFPWWKIKFHGFDLGALTLKLIWTLWFHVTSLYLIISQIVWESSHWCHCFRSLSPNCKRLELAYQPGAR